MRWRIGCGMFVIVLCLTISTGQSTTGRLFAPAPKLEAVAETKLLMQGLLAPNHAGLGSRLKEKPGDAETWNIVRGQSLLIGEGGNLLMLRPPKSRPAQDVWMVKATELRTAAVKAANAAAKQDYLGTRAAVANLANVCNRCHETFGIKQRVEPFSE